MTEERIQKILARAGYGSRRASEELISGGRVTVNGQRAVLGAKADAAVDEIRVDGVRIHAEQEMIYIALYKPRGVLSTTGGPDRRRKVVDLVPGGDKLQMVGRLDLDSEGLMLLTNDGPLIQQLTHPRFGHNKEYKVLVAKQPDQQQLDTWRRGVVLPDGAKTQPAEVRVERPYGKGAWLRVIMKEGKKRQIRETATLLGLPVAKLIRIRIASLKVGAMRSGDWRPLTADEVAELKGASAAGDSGKARRRPPREQTAARKMTRREPRPPEHSGRGRSQKRE
jgi:23S rRNA pseudouridine2605 synthase